MSGIFDPLRHGHRALDYHMERHNVLASNVANIDTPGFDPSELVRNAQDPLRTGAPTATHGSHIGQRSEHEAQTSERFEQVVRPGGDGNSVSLEREMAKVSANDLRFEAIGKMVRAQLGALRYAASDANG